MTDQEIRLRALELVARAHCFPSTFSNQEGRVAEYLINIAKPIVAWLKDGDQS